MTNPIYIEAVYRAATRLENAKENLHSRIRVAHENGASLRKIAEVAGMSHEQVRSLIRSDQT